jgi:fatty acid desaturase
MDRNVSTSTPAENLEAAWQARQIHWRRKLGRLRLGVEPIDEQLARYRRVTWVLTAIPAVLGLIFFTLFAVFGYPVVGLVFVAIVLLPIVLGAWSDFALMTMRARRYQQEADDYFRQKERHRSASGQ